MAVSNEASVERALSSLLDALAILLLEQGVTASRLDQIAKASLVKAGAKHAKKKSSGRPHLAQIAAKTGLTRAEVKRIVSSNFAFAGPSPDSWPRARRVLNAWRNSKQFVSGGRPRRLRIAGTRGSFAELCRLHSGDIPPRVILSELELTGCVKLNPGRTHVSVVNAKENQSNSKELEAALVFAASFIEHAFRSEAVLLRRRQKVAHSSELPAAYFEEAISGRVSDLLDQMPKLFPKVQRRSRNRVNIFALVTRELGK